MLFISIGYVLLFIVFLIALICYLKYRKNALIIKTKKLVLTKNLSLITIWILVILIILLTILTMVN